MFSCEFREIFKSTFLTEHLWVAASDICFGGDFINLETNNFNKSDTCALMELLMSSTLGEYHFHVYESDLSYGPSFPKNLSGFIT